MFILCYLMNYHLILLCDNLCNLIAISIQNIIYNDLVMLCYNHLNIYTLVIISSIYLFHIYYPCINTQLIERGDFYFFITHKLR